jgi:hypothetical protein
LREHRKHRRASTRAAPAQQAAARTYTDQDPTLFNTAVQSVEAHLSN